LLLRGLWSTVATIGRSFNRPEPRATICRSSLAGNDKGAEVGFDHKPDRRVVEVLCAMGIRSIRL